MESHKLNIFKTNIEAIAVNRGFYFQYLVTLKKWIKNYVEEKDVNTLIEVENDIKEVGDKLIFTQIKCYTKAFSLNSTEVKKALFDFFMLFLEYRTEKEDVEFCFSTNTSIAKNEKLLANWIIDNQLEDHLLKGAVNKKIADVLNDELNIRKKQKLQSKLNIGEKQGIKSSAETLKKIISDSHAEFVKFVKWEFLDFSPEESINQIRKQIETLLMHEKFGGRPFSLLFSVFISEIYRCSQDQLKENRILNGKILENLLIKSDDELSQFVDVKLTILLRIQFEVLRDEINQIKLEQKLQSEEIQTLKESEGEKRKKELPKNLTLLPDCFTTDTLGWDDFLQKVRNVVVDKKIVSVYAEGGMGKTAFAKKYFRTFTAYDHVIWINVEQSIAQAFVFDEMLTENLGINFAITQDAQSRFRLLLNELSKIMGSNLMIIDIQSADDEIVGLRELSSLHNWEKIVLTRHHYHAVTALRLPRISFEHAKEIYLQNSVNASEEVFGEFFGFIDFNPLVIELTAKTIRNSITLTLESFLESLKEQRLDGEEFNIDIEINDENRPIRIFSYLIHKFSLSNLENDEKHYLNFLALLPSNNIVLEELVLINGKDFYQENVITISNIIVALEKKGLVTYNVDRTKINIHKVIQETIIYKERARLNPFISNFEYIVWLTARITEGANKPVLALKFLKYAESILHAIKEEYRIRLFQPLLLLENELLYAYRFFINTSDELNKWKDLAKRAEKHLLSTDNQLAVIYNNVGLAYANNAEHEKAKLYFNKALQIFKKNETQMIQQIIVASNNISNIFLKEENLTSAMEVFRDVQKLRKKYNLYDDQQLGIEYRILAESYVIAGDYHKAIELSQEGIRLHKSLKPENRNDFYLSAYYNQLSNLFLLTEEFDKALLSQEIAVQILENMQLNSSEHLLWMYEILIRLYRFGDMIDKENQIAQKIEAFNKFEVLNN